MAQISMKQIQYQKLAVTSKNEKGFLKDKMFHLSIFHLSSFRFDDQASLSRCICLTLAVGIRWTSLAMAGLTHPDRAATPAPFWHRHPAAGTRVAETLPT